MQACVSASDFPTASSIACDSDMSTSFKSLNSTIWCMDCALHLPTNSLCVCVLPLTVVQVAAVAGVAPQLQLARFVKRTTCHLHHSSHPF